MKLQNIVGEISVYELRAEQAELQMINTKMRRALIYVPEEEKNQVSVNSCGEIKTEYFVEAGSKYGVDWKLIYAIAELESQMGLHTPPGSCNPFGRVCGKGYVCIKAKDNSSGSSIYWNSYGSFRDAIFDQAEYLREKYLDIGLVTIDQIGRKYAESPYWSSKIKNIIYELP